MISTKIYLHNIQSSNSPTKGIKDEEVKMLFPSYELLRLIMEPRDVGHQGVRRKRAFLFLRHKKRCEYLMDLYNVFNMTSRGVQRAVSTEPRDYLVSSNAVQQVQNSHMARKRKITHQPDPCQCNKLILFCV